MHIILYADDIFYSYTFVCAKKHLNSANFHIYNLRQLGKKLCPSVSKSYHQELVINFEWDGCFKRFDVWSRWNWTVGMARLPSDKSMCLLVIGLPLSVSIGGRCGGSQTYDDSSVANLHRFPFTVNMPCPCFYISSNYLLQNGVWSTNRFLKDRFIFLLMLFSVA